MNAITAPKVVEISIRDDGKVIWINVDGKCQLCCCEIQNLVLDDRRKFQFNEPTKKFSGTAKEINQMIRDSSKE